jgi:sulfate/thiosulfate transport system permease protein
MASTAMHKGVAGVGLPWARYGVRALVFAYVALLLAMPLLFLARTGLQWDVDEVGRQLLAPAAWSAFQGTLWTATLVTALNALMGVVTAYVLVRHPFPGHGLLNALVDLPLVIPTLVAGGLWARFGQVEPVGERWFVPSGALWALLVVTFPFVVRSVEPVLRRLERVQEDAAASLGAGAWTIFWRITLPPLWLPLLVGALLTFARTIGELAALLIVAASLPVVMQTSAVQQPGVIVIAMVMLASACLLTLLVEGLQRQRQHEAVRRPVTVSTPRPAARIGRWRRRLLIGLACLYGGGLLIAFLAQVVGSLFQVELMAALGGLRQLQSWSLLGFGLVIAPATMLVQGILGTLLAWVLVHHDFSGRGWVKSLLALPFALSPIVIAFTISLLLTRTEQVRLGPTLDAVPLVILATLFVTLPLFVRKLIPPLRAAGLHQAHTAALLGASSWQHFWLVTLPAIRGGLLSGATLTFVRALGEFTMMVVIGSLVR